MLARLFYNQLPEWARPTHPVMRYTLAYKPIARRTVVVRLLIGLLVLGVAVAMGYAFTQQNSDVENPTYREYVYYPLVAAQLLTQIFALAITSNAIAIERQKGTWDSLQITLSGAGNAVRTRWALAFYRMRWILAAIIIGRLGYIYALMNDMVDMEGRAIDVRIIGISPEISLDVAIFLLAALMAAAILQPLVMVGLNAAVGVWLSTLSKRRGVGILTTVTLMILQVAVTAAALLAGHDIIGFNGTKAQIVEMSVTESWARSLLLAITGDQSLRLLNLETLGTLWADLENGIYLGGVMLGIMLVLALLSNVFIFFAARHAAQPGRT